MSFLFLDLILLVLVGFLLTLLSMVWPPDSPWAPFWRTDKKTARAMCKLSEVSKKDTIYDLGSGDGTALIVASKEFGARGVGIEIDPLRVVVSKLRVKFNNLSGNVTIKKKNFFSEDISDATIIFVYLIPKALGKLLPKFKKELKKGTKIVSYRYAVNLPIVERDEKNEIFVYKI